MLNRTQTRKLRHLKGERIHVQKGAPNPKDLQENIPEIRFESGKVFQYIRIGSKVYRHEFHPIGSVSNREAVATSDIQRTNQSGGAGWSHRNGASAWTEDGPPMWMKFDNGVMMQWGVLSTSATGNYTVELPKKYEHDLWLIFTTQNDATGDAEETGASRKYKTGTEYYLDKFTLDMDMSGNQVVGWMTLGW